MVKKRSLTLEECIKLLPDSDMVHIFRSTKNGLVGMEWHRDAVIEWIRSKGAELAGDNARRANHGIATYSQAFGQLFIQTRSENG